MEPSIIAPRFYHVPLAPTLAFGAAVTGLLLVSKIAALVTIITAVSLVILHRVMTRYNGENVMLAQHIWSFIQEKGAVIVAALSYFFPTTCLNPKEFDPNQPIIVTLPGYAHNSSGMHYLRHKLRRAGFKNIVSLNLSGFIFNPFKSIDDFSENLKQNIDNLQLPPGKKIIIIAHSTGGVTALNYAVNNHDKVEKVITIASPIFGTHMAKYGIGECTRQMIPGSEFMLDLNQSIREHDFQIVNIGSHTDMVVQPNDNAFIHNRENTTHYHFGYHGHLSLLYSHYTADILIKECRSGEV